MAFNVQGPVRVGEQTCTRKSFSDRYRLPVQPCSAACLFTAKL